MGKKHQNSSKGPKQIELFKIQGVNCTGINTEAKNYRIDKTKGLRHQ